MGSEPFADEEICTSTRPDAEGDAATDGCECDRLRSSGDAWPESANELPDASRRREHVERGSVEACEDGRREPCFFTAAPRPYNKTSTAPGPRHNVSVRYACGRRFDAREWSLLHMVDPNSSSYSSIVHHRHPRHRHGAALLDLWAYSEDYHKHPQACFWPPFPSNETGWDRYACKGGVRVAAVPLPSEL